MKILLIPLLIMLTSPLMAGEVNVYSVYSADVLKPVFKPFTERTGIEVNILSDSSKNLLDRIESEGKYTPGDLHLDKDIVYLGKGARKGLYQGIESKVVENNIPSKFMQSKKNWFLMLYRTRQIIYNENKVSPNELSTYEDLAAPKWKGRLCLRTSQKSYNQALAGFMVAHHGVDRAREIFEGWVDNLAQEPSSGDTALIRSVKAGECDVAIINHYYLAPFLEENPDFVVKPFFPNQQTTKTHLNGVGVALLKHSKNIKEATKLMEYLSTAEWQSPVAKGFNQFPTNPKGSVSPVLRSFGEFDGDKTNVGVISNFTDLGLQTMIEADYK